MKKETTIATSYRLTQKEIETIHLTKKIILTLFEEGYDELEYLLESISYWDYKFRDIFDGIVLTCHEKKEEELLTEE